MYIQSQSESEQGFKEPNEKNRNIEIVRPSLKDELTEFRSSSMQTKSNKKIAYRHPLCILNTITLFKNLSQIQDMSTIIHRVFPKQDKQENVPLSNILPSNIDKNANQQQQLSLSINASSLLNNKFSQVFPKKYVCVYNKFREILGNKSDMTIVIRNIKSIVSNDMLKDFSSRLIEEERIQKSLSVRNHTEISNSNIWQQNSNIIFNSQFESGNLHSVFRDKKNPYLYYLFLQNDINTHGFSQWFFFSVTSKINQKVRFVIMNLSKEIKELKGLSLTVLNKNHWERGIQFITYKNKFNRSYGTNFYTLDFQYDFGQAQKRSLSFKKQIQEQEKDKTELAKYEEFLKQHRKDSIHNKIRYFCLVLPYTYTRLTYFLKKIQKNKYNSLSWCDIMIDSIGKSEGNNYIPYVKMFSPKANIFPHQKSQCVIIIARQHPGQSVSSFVCEKIIQCLSSNLGKNDKNLCLLQLYNWYIIPMANPDGVIHGNTRTNLKGYDINRCWDKASIKKCSQVQLINQWIKKINENEHVQYVFDLHGHSKIAGSCCYYSEKNQITKLLSYQLCQTQFFDYNNFRYGVSHKKRMTFRGQMFHRFGIKNSITIETSLYGFMKDNQFVQYSENHFQQIAEVITQAIWDVHIVKAKMNGLQRTLILKKLKQMETISVMGDQRNIQSQSDPQGDYLAQAQRIQLQLDSIPGQQLFNPTRKKMLTNQSKNLKSQPALTTSYNAKLRQTKVCKFRTIEKVKTRRPIYTSKNIKMDDLNKSILNASLSKEGQFDHLKTHLAIRKKIRNAYQRSSQQLLQSKKKFSASRYDNTQLYKCQQISQYPTAFDIKLDLKRIHVSNRYSQRQSQSFSYPHFSLLEHRNQQKRKKDQQKLKIQKSLEISAQKTHILINSQTDRQQI